MKIDRRSVLRALPAGLLASPFVNLGSASTATAAQDPKVRQAVQRGLDWLKKSQQPGGRFDARGQYRVPMTALAGMAMVCEGSTTTQGRYARQIRLATDYLISQTRQNGLIGEPEDYRYTYGHGFSMMFLSQILGEEEDARRRADLIEVLSKAVEFSGRAQTPSGGWGYVSSKDGNGFDEGSTTITQVQGLRGCRNAGIPVPKEVINNAIKYIKDCTLPDGGVCYSSKNRNGGRPAITAAALAGLFNAGAYDSEYVPKLLSYCKKHLNDGMGANSFGHWHYTYYYYSQVMYRQGGEEWKKFKDTIFPKVLKEQGNDGSWQGNIGPVYVTAINLTMLQLDNAAVPIYTR